MDRGEKEPLSIGDIISSSLETGFLGLAKDLVRVFDVWHEAVGAFNASKARPESVKNGRLTVTVESSVWIDRFGYFKGEFMEKINQALGGPVIKEIVFRVGALPPKEDKSLSARGADPSPAPPSEDAPDVQAIVAGVKEPALREQLAGLLSRQTGRRKE